MRIMPTLIAAALGALAAWSTVLIAWSLFLLAMNCPWAFLAVILTVGGSALGVALYVEFAEIDELYEEFTEIDE